MIWDGFLLDLRMILLSQIQITLRVVPLGMVLNLDDAIFSCL